MTTGTNVYEIVKRKKNTMLQQRTCNNNRRRRRRGASSCLLLVIFISTLSSSSAGLLDGSVDQSADSNDKEYEHKMSNKRPSSSSNNKNWWDTMYEGLPGSTDEARPANRRGHSATHFIDEHNNEWMIISGGFTDEDWYSFPVWAYDITAGKTIEAFVDSTPGKEIDNFDSGYEDQNLELFQHPWVKLGFTKKSDDDEAPQGRVGHKSSTYNDCLYIFGGLTYKFGFNVEYPDGGYNSLVVWRGCGLNHYLQKREELVWEKIVPRVHGQYPVNPMQGISDNQNVTSGDVNTTTTTTTSEEEVVGDDDHDLRTLDDLLIIANTNKEGGSAPHFSILPRGELQGGHYAPEDDDKEYFIFHGGVIQGDLQKTGEVALGDVWKYDYEENTLSLLSPYPPLEWQNDERDGLYPTSRTAHAGTVVGDELIIHGGMHPSEDMPASSFASPSDSYATYKTSSKWKPLSDVWAFNLKTLKWKERIQYPQMARSYHTLVGSDSGEIAAFGGFQQDSSQYNSETVVFVFKDLLISRPNETHWLKLMPSADQFSHSLIRESYRNTYLLGISNRLEHSAILDNDGSMLVWGGRFQTTGQISGLWRLDVFTEDANLRLETAPPDGIEEYERELEALHLFLVTMMFMSLTISSLLGSMRGRGEEQEVVERPSHRRGGLSPEVINSIPVKRYESPRRRSVTDDGDVVEDVSLSRENSTDEGGLDDADCCAICFEEYEEGVSEIRTLPCGHSFDKECIDSWLEGHTTCPSCRQGIENSPLSSPVSDTSPSTPTRLRLESSWLVGGLGGVLLNQTDWGNESESASSPEAASSDTTSDYVEGLQEAMPGSRGLLRFFNRRIHEPIPTRSPTSNEESLTVNEALTPTRRSLLSVFNRTTHQPIPLQSPTSNEEVEMV